MHPSSGMKGCLQLVQWVLHCMFCSLEHYIHPFLVGTQVLQILFEWHHLDVILLIYV